MPKIYTGFQSFVESSSPDVLGLIQIYTYLINCSINKGIFPDELNIAKVIPIYKSGDKTSIENYGPISVSIFQNF